MSFEQFDLFNPPEKPAHPEQRPGETFLQIMELSAFNTMKHEHPDLQSLRAGTEFEDSVDSGDPHHTKTTTFVPVFINREESRALKTQSTSQE